MKLMGVALIFSLISALSSASVLDCSALLSNSNLKSESQNTQTYLSLVTYLVKEKNVLSSSALRDMAFETGDLDPMKYVSDKLSAEDRFAFNRAFNSLKNINWETVREKLKSLAEDSTQDETQRQEARDNARFIYAPVPIHSWFENREFGKNEFFNSPSGLAFVGYERNKGTYFFDLNTNQERLVSAEYQQTTFVRLKSGLGVIARSNSKRDIFVEEALTGKLIAALKVSDLFPNFWEGSLENIEIRIYERPDGHLRLIGERGPLLPGLRGVYDFSSTGGHGFAVSVSLLPGTGIYTLQDGTILKYMGEWEPELELKELSEVPPSKTLLNIKAPIELSDAAIRPTDTTRMKGKFLEAADGRSFYLTYNHSGFVIYDLRTLENKIVKLEESFGFSLWGEVAEVNGELKIVDFDQRGSLLEVKIGDFKGKVQIIEFKDTHNIVPSFHILRLRDGRTLGAIPTARPDGGALIKEVQLVDLATGSVQQIKFYNEKFTRLMALKELEGGEIVGFFLDTGNKIVATQLYGPAPVGEIP